MKIQIALLFNFFSVTSLFAQLSMTIDKTLLEGQPVSYSSISEQHGVLVMDDHSIYILDVQNAEVTEVSSAFSEMDLSNISCVLSINKDVFLIGTSNAFIFKYQNGLVTQINDSNGLMQSEITSFRNSDFALYVGTNKGIFISIDLDTFTPLYPDNDVQYGVTFLGFESSPSEYIKHSDTSCGNIEGISHIFDSYTAVYENGFTTLDELKDIDKISDAFVIYSAWRFYQSVGNIYFGTNHGFRYFNMHDCYPTPKTLLDNVEVNDLYVLPHQGFLELDRTMFIGTNSGLYYIDTLYNDYWNPTVLKFAALGEEKVRTINYNLCSNQIYLGTENGLVILNIDQTPTLKSIYQEEERAFCYNNPVEIGGLNYKKFDFQWYRDNTPLEGETGSQITVTEPGLYEQYYENCRFSGKNKIMKFNEVTSIDARLSFDGVTEKCYDDYTELRISKNDYYPSSEYQLTYEWYKNGKIIDGETEEYLTGYLTSGEYYFIATNCNNYTLKSKSVFIQMRDSIPVPQLSPNSIKDNYCYGDTLRLTNAAEYDVKWKYYSFETLSTNSNYFKLNADRNPNTIIYNDDFGCASKFNIDLPYSMVRPADIDIPADTVFKCPDISYEYNNWSPYAKIIWSDGVVANQRSIRQPGVYILSATNPYSNCNAVIDTLIIGNLDTPDFTLPADTILNVGDTLVLELDKNFQYYWSYGPDDDNFQKIITSSTPKTIELTVQISDNQSCNGFDKMLIKFTDGVVASNNQFVEKAYTTYPNPFQQKFYVSGDLSKINRIEIYNVTGQLIYSSDVYEKLKNGIELTNVKSGIYYIKLFNTNGVRSFHSILKEQ